jgi:hypothetical protein
MPKPGAGDPGEAGAGRRPEDPSGSASDPDQQQTDRQKTQQPDGSPPGQDLAPAKTKSKKQSDSEGEFSGDQSGGGQQGPGQGANQRGNDSPGSNTTSDEGAGQATEAGSGDAYLELRHSEFLDDLRQHREEGKWWWGQEVTDEMLDYVHANPEVGGGVREGRVVYEAKIPYQTTEHVASEADASRYHYCHCPWARESLRRDELDVPPVFCNCSAAFHKKPWDVIFGQELEAEVLESVLAGGDRCRFAIHLPDDAVLSRDDA